MTGLIERLQQAKEGSRELSDEVLLSCGWRREGFARPSFKGAWDKGMQPGWVAPVETLVRSEAPDPTRSLDDALKYVVPEGWQWRLHNVGYDEGVYQGGKALFELRHPLSSESNPRWRVFAWTTSLAVCAASIAALKARVKEKP